MTEEEREDLLGLDTSTDAPDAEDAGEELMAAALDAGLEAADEQELDPEVQFRDESVKVGRGDADVEAEEHVASGGSLMSV
jgi:hypothetical protein